MELVFRARSRTMKLIFTYLILLLLLASGTLSIPISSTNSPEADYLRSFVLKPTESIDGGEGRGNPWIEAISWEPRAFILHNFLSKEECESLIEFAKPRMQRSTVIDSTTGRILESRVRTGSAAYLARGQDAIVQNIEKRIADFTFMPVDHGEGLQVIHYEVGQKYEPHFDFFLDEFNTRNGGQRIATVLMYLSDVEEGGETFFPLANGNHSADLSRCGTVGISVKPKMGDALLFWNMNPDATSDSKSLHGSCPVIKGNKWVCTKWVRVKKYKV